MLDRDYAHEADMRRLAREQLRADISVDDDDAQLPTLCADEWDDEPLPLEDYDFDAEKAYWQDYAF